MRNTPIFSLIVPTINRAVELEKLLISLRQQTVKDFEVLIVDQNKDDRVLRVISQFVSKLDITHIRLANKGASRARNAGLNRARGKIVTFPDDDCEYSPGLLKKILEAFDRYADIDGVTTCSRDKNFEGRLARLSKSKQYINKYNILSCLVEFTVFLRSACIQNVNFDEDMGVGASTPWWSDEGPDFVLRLINKGSRFIYCPDIVIYHPDPVKKYDKTAITRSYKYGKGRGKYLRKHNYPLWFITYVWGLYLAGILLGCLQFNAGKIRYYWKGLEGRVKGYVNANKRVH